MSFGFSDFMDAVNIGSAFLIYVKYARLVNANAMCYNVTLFQSIA